MYKRIKDLREDKDLSIRELADLLHMHRTTYYNYETGKRELPFELAAGTEMVMPGDNIDMTIELITPIAIEKGLRFAIREGGRTVGSGVVADIIE